MNRDQFITFASPLLRHGLTIVAGVLAAKGYLSTASDFDAYAAPVVIGVATIAWSLLEKNKLVATTLSGLNGDDIALLTAALAKLRKQGASPVLVAHTAQVLAAVAVGEANAFAVGAVPLPDPDPTAETLPVDPQP